MARFERLAKYVKSMESLSETIVSGDFGYAIQKIQPAYSLTNGEQWYEWLLRPRLRGKAVDASEFIQTVQSFGLELELDVRVTTDALRWLSAQPRDTRLSINVSAASISNARFSLHFLSRIKMLGVEPEQVCVEITEQQGIDDLEIATHFSKTLRQLGASIAIDDIGAGTMHLGLFAPLHLVDYIKIDRGWIMPALDSEAHRKTAEGLMDFGKRLDVGIIAEGVETAQHLEMVRDMGCDFYQGFIDGMPRLVSGTSLSAEEGISDYSRTA